MPSDRLLSPQDVADFLGVPLATVYVWNSRRTGPPRVRIGKHIRYLRADLDAWVERSYADGATPART